MVKIVRQVGKYNKYCNMFVNSNKKCSFDIKSVLFFLFLQTESHCFAGHCFRKVLIVLRLLL